MIYHGSPAADWVNAGAILPEARGINPRYDTSVAEPKAPLPKHV
jgi:hypothetical protein